MNNYLLAESAADEKPMTDLMKLQNMGLENDEEVRFSPLFSTHFRLFSDLFRLSFGDGSGDLTHFCSALLSVLCFR